MLLVGDCESLESGRTEVSSFLSVVVLVTVVVGRVLFEFTLSLEVECSNVDNVCASVEDEYSELVVSGVFHILTIRFCQVLVLRVVV